MPGVFSKSALPVLPGSYVDFTSNPPDPILQPAIGIVAVPFTHTWGPENRVVLLNSWSDFLQYYGAGVTPGAAQTPGSYSPGYVAVSNAFRGEGLPGRAGAAQVVAYRLVGSGGMQASHALSNGATGAITLTAIYKGTFGNNLSVANVTNAADNTKADLDIYLGTQLVETFTYTKTQIQALANMINDPVQGSKWVSAGSITDGTALTVVSTPAALTGGNDGSTLVSGDWTNVQAALESVRFSVFAPFDLTDSSIQASFLAWIQQKNSAGKRFMSVFGGAAGEAVSAAVTRATALADPNIVTVGVGTYTDGTFGDLSTSQLATRVAGILAERGEQSSITFARLNGLTVKIGATDADTLTALNGGVVTLARDSHPTAPVRLQKATTTFTAGTHAADSQRPFPIYSQPKFVRVMQALETEMTETAENQDILGRVPVDDATRKLLAAMMQNLLDRRVEESILQPGAAVMVDPTLPPSPTDNFVALVYQVQFFRTLDMVLNTIVVS